MLYIWSLSTMHFLSLFSISCLDFLLTWSFSSLPHHLLSLFHSFTCGLWLSLYMSVQLFPLLALLLIFLIQPQKKHTGCKLCFVYLFIIFNIVWRSVEMYRMSLRIVADLYVNLLAHIAPTSSQHGNAGTWSSLLLEGQPEIRLKWKSGG